MISRCPPTIRRSRRGLLGWFRGMEKDLKLPAHPVRTGQARRGLPGKVISFYIVPPDPAYPAWAGRGRFRSDFQWQAKSRTSYWVDLFPKRSTLQAQPLVSSAWKAEEQIFDFSAAGASETFVSFSVSVPSIPSVPRLHPSSQLFQTR